MVRKTKIKRKRNVKKTRRRRIRGGVKTKEEEEDDVQRRIYNRQRRVAEMKANEEAAKKREAEAAAVQHAARVQDKMKKETDYYVGQMKQRWADKDESDKQARDSAYSGWVVGQSFPVQTADFKPASDIINRNKAGFNIIYAFYLGSLSLLEDRDTITPGKIKALITKLVEDIKTYINQHAFIDSPAQLAKQYYLGVDADNIDENYFERISILHGGGMGLGKDGATKLSIIQNAGINLGILLKLFKSTTADDEMDAEFIPMDVE
jgi:hypothetical protein